MSAYPAGFDDAQLPSPGNAGPLDAARLWALVNSSVDLIQIVDAEGRITFISSAAERLLGYAPNALLGVNGFSLIHPDDLAEATERFGTLLNEGGSLPFEVRVRRRDGSWRWFELLGQNLLDDPLVCGLILSARDIDDRKRTALQLLRQRELLAAIAGASGLLLSDEPIEQAVMQALETVARALGTGFAGVFEFHSDVDGEPAVSRRFLWTAERFRPPPDHRPYAPTPVRELGLERWHAILQSGAELQTIVSALPERERLRMERWGFRSMLVVPIFLRGTLWGEVTLADLTRERAWDADEVAGVRAFAASVGEALARHQALSALTASESRFRSMLQSSSEFITVLDADFRIIFQSDSAGRVLGLAPGPFPRAVRWDLIHPTDQEPYRQVLAAVAQTPGGSVTIEYRSLNNAGRWLHLESVVTNHLNDPAVHGFVINSRDITERKLSEQALERKRSLLEAIAEATSRLLVDTDLDATINIALAQLGQAAEVDRVSLFELRPHPQTGLRASNKRYEWRQAGLPPRLDDARLRDFPMEGSLFDEFYQRLRAGHPVSVQVADLPPAQRAELSRFGLRSILMTPIFTDGRFWGYISLYGERAARLWSSDEPALLQSIAGGIGGALSRHAAHSALQRQSELLREVGEAANALLTMDDFSGAIGQALTTLGHACGVDDVTLYRIDRDEAAQDYRTLRRYRWDRTAGASELGEEAPFLLLRSGFERWAQHFERGEVIAGAPAHFPDIEFSLLAAGDAQSLLAMPVRIGARLAGMLVLCARTSARDWTGEELAVLATAARSLGGAIKRAEGTRALRASEERFRSLVQNTADMFAILSPSGDRLLYASASVARILGYPLELLPRLDRMQPIHPQDAARLRADFSRVVEAPGQTLVSELRVRRADGSYLPVEASFTNLIDQPSVGGIVINARDISERRAAEENLRRKSTVLAAVAEALAELLLSGDLDEGITRALALLGEAADVSRVTLYQFHADALTGRQLGTKRNEWVAPDAEPRLDHPGVRDVPFEAGPFDYFYRELSAGRIVSNHVREFPEPVRGALEAFTTKSICLVPLYADEQLWGYLGFDSDSVERAWSLDDQAALRAAAGGVSAAIVSRRAQQALHAGGERFRAMVQNGSDIIVIFDDEDRVTYVSPSVERVLGWTPAEIISQSRFDFVHPDEHRHTTEQVQRLRRSPGASMVLELRVRHKDGGWRHIESVYTNLIDEPHIGGVVVNSRDITERRLLQEQLAWQAFHDPLTGLPNRLLFLDRLEQALQRAERRNETVTIMFLDLDRFKVVNDSLGHATGDDLLVTIGQRLAQGLRSGDTVARIGGDEFTILLEDTYGLDEVTQIADRILRWVRMPVRLPGGHEAYVTASIGIAISNPAGPLSASDLLRSADVALYRAKDEGKARWTIFESEMNEHAVSRLLLETDLQRALARHELCLYFQPEFDLHSGALHGVEALLRWQSPERALVQPAAFLEVAEETGLIVPIGRWVLREACRQLQEWQRAGLAPPDLLMSVNLSASEFRQLDLAEFIESVLIEHELEPANLRLELTESVVLQDAQAAQRMLETLKALGVHLAIDDFGKGYSSLSYLSHLPVDTLKIDRAFIAHPGQDRRSLAIIEAVTTLAHALGMVVTAEGIETPEHVQRVLAAGCDFGQGFHFAHPVTPAALAELLTRTHSASVVP